MTTVEIELTVSEQRKLVEAEAGEHCFRIRLTAEEYVRSKKDFTGHKLKNGDYGIWRPISSLHQLRNDGKADLAKFIESRIIEDTVV